MENFGIILSLPGGLVVGVIYAVIIGALTSNFRWLIKPFVYASIIILLGLLLELGLLATLGAVRSRSSLGPLFALGHFIIFVFGAPALANLLVVPPRMRYLGHQIVAGIAFGVLFCVLVVLQYCVTDSLYGKNGDTGPFSLLPASNDPPHWQSPKPTSPQPETSSPRTAATAAMKNLPTPSSPSPASNHDRSSEASLR
jgi:hypothetical protein